APGGDDGAPAIAVAQPPVRARLEMVGVVLEHELARRGEDAPRVHARLDGVVDARERRVRPLPLGHVEGDVRQDLQHRVEQTRVGDAAGLARGEPRDEAPAEAMADPNRTLDPGRLDDVLEVRVERPGRVPARPAVPTKIERAHGETLPEVRSEAAVASP